MKTKPAHGDPTPVTHEVELELRGSCFDVKSQSVGTRVHVFSYDKKWTKDQTEPDDKGVMCRQTIWDKKHEKWSTVEGVLFQIFINEGVVSKILMPLDGVVVVKTYRKGEQNPQVNRYVRERK